jgi:hypothetical protein
MNKLCESLCSYSPGVLFWLGDEQFVFTKGKGLDQIVE